MFVRKRRYSFGTAIVYIEPMLARLRNIGEANQGTGSTWQSGQRVLVLYNTQRTQPAIQQPAYS